MRSDNRHNLGAEKPGQKIEGRAGHSQDHYEDLILRVSSYQYPWIFDVEKTVLEGGSRDWLACVHQKRAGKRLDMDVLGLFFSFVDSCIALP